MFRFLGEDLAYGAAGMLDQAIGYDLGWSPNVFGQRLRVGLHAEAGITLNGTDLSAWGDQSAHANGPTQGTPANQPTWTSITVSSGKQAVDFDGTSHFMIATGLSTTETFYSAFVVIENDSTTGDGRILDAQTGRIIMSPDHTSAYGVFDTAWRTAGTSDTNLKAIVYQLDSATVSTIYVNNASVGTITWGQKAIGGTASLGSNFGGSGNFLNARIREFGIVAGPPLTAAERLALYNYHQIDSGVP